MSAMPDAETRSWLARHVAEHKGTDDVRPMFRKTEEVAGKVPSNLTSNGADNFAEAHRTEYAPRNSLWKDSEHESHIHMAGDRNNNQMGSFNGNTVRLREGSTRGLKTDNSAILSGSTSTTTASARTWGCRSIPRRGRPPIYISEVETV